MITFLLIGKAIAQTPEEFTAKTITFSLEKLREFRSSVQENKSISQLIDKEFLPKINQDKATEVVFSKYWNKLTPENKITAKGYLLKSILSDYSAMLSSYKEDNRVIFNILPKTKRKNNLAIVFANIGTTQSNPKPVAFKLISHDDTWKIYDVVIMGTSLLKTYKYMINSKIKRRGLDIVLQSI